MDENNKEEEMTKEDVEIVEKELNESNTEETDQIMNIIGSKTTMFGSLQIVASVLFSMVAVYETNPLAAGLLLKITSDVQEKLRKLPFSQEDLDTTKEMLKGAELRRAV